MKKHPVNIKALLDWFENHGEFGPLGPPGKGSLREWKPGVTFHLRPCKPAKTPPHGESRRLGE